MSEDQTESESVVTEKTLFSFPQTLLRHVSLLSWTQEPAAPSRKMRYDQDRSCFDIGNVRTRFPVAAKIAPVSAGIAGGSAGSPRPVGAKFVFRKCTSIGGAWRMRSSGKLLKLVCTVRPRSIVISCASASAMPSSAAPCTLLSAFIGLMI